MNVYIAAPYQLKADAQRLRDELGRIYIGCTSTWLAGDAEDCETRNDANAKIDLADVGRADALVLLNPPSFANSGTGGRHVELGFALALRKPIYLIGAKSNIFHEHSDVSVVSNDLEFIGLLLEQMEVRR